MKYGFKNPPSKIEDVAVKVASKNPLATKNAAGGQAYLIPDAGVKLITMTGGHFFNEKVYHGMNDPNSTGLTPQAQEVVDTARAVAHSQNPHDLLAIANWLRNDKLMRTTPAILFAVAASEEQNRDRMIEYATKILKRPDDVRQAFAAYFALNGEVTIENGRVIRKAKLPNSFKKALAKALNQFDEYQLLKYEATEWPTYKDMLAMVDRKANYPISKPLMDYFIKGTVPTADQAPILAARKELFALPKTWTSKVSALALKAHVQWDQLSSHFGKTREMWEALIDGGKVTLPYMAMIKNLRNIQESNVSNAHWDKVEKAVVDGVKTSKMYPFQFLAARENTVGTNDSHVADMVLDAAASNLPDIPGDTFIMTDISGSMDQAISDGGTKNKSGYQMTKYKAGAALTSVLAKALGPRRAIIGGFGTDFLRINFTGSDSVWRIYKEIEAIRHKTGWATKAHKSFEYLITNKIKVDRVIVISDMQCYNLGPGFGTDSKSFQSKFLEYKTKFNPDCKLYSIDIGAQGTSVAPATDKGVYLTSGFNESVLKEIRVFESLESDQDTSKSQVPSLDYVRANF